MVVDGNSTIMNDIKNLEWLEIFLWYACNVKCSFCYQKDLRLEYKNNIEKEKVLNLIDDWFNQWKRFIIFSWWEATLDKNLSYYIWYAKNKGFEHIRVHTNGFWFKKYDYLQNLFDQWLTGVIISVHWFGKIHDSISRAPGSFQNILKALINFEKLKAIEPSFVFDTNTVICKQNYKYLEKLIVLLSKFTITRGQLVMPYTLDLFTHQEKLNLIPEFKNCIPYIIKLLDIWVNNNKRFVIENIPFCKIANHYWMHIIDNIKTIKDAVTLSDTYKSNLDDSWMKKWNDCQKCIMNNVCKWVPQDYFKIYPDTELKPIYE